MEVLDLPRNEAPSRKTIARATGIALAIALLILFTAVLPAEYGIDPLKTGAALHLTDLARANETKPASASRTSAAPVLAPAGVYTAQSKVY